MINDKEKQYFTVGLHDRSLGAEAVGDYTLPDYQSEIRRILHVDQTVLPPSVYVGSDSVEVGGTVDYQVIYVGGDGGIYSAPLSGEYNFSVPFDRGNLQVEDVYALCSVCAEGVSTRVSAPRRLNVRSRLRANVRVLGKVAADDGVATEDSASLFKRIETCRSVYCESAVSELIPLNYSAPLTSDDMRVISAVARVCVTDRDCGSDSVSCRGRVELELLCSAEESGEMSKMTADIPFEGEIDVESCSVGDVARVDGVLSEMTVNVSDEGIACDMGIMLQAHTFRPWEVSYTADAYSTSNQCTCRISPVRARHLLACANSNVTFSERVALADTAIPEGAEVVDARCSVVMDKCAENEGRYAFGGNARFAVIWQSAEDVGCSEVNMPVRLEVSGMGRGVPVSFDAHAEATDIRVRIEDSELRVDAEMMISADCMGEDVVGAVMGAELGEMLMPRGSELTVCYPMVGDTLWEVAKRYRVSPDAVMGDPEKERYVMIE